MSAFHILEPATFKDSLPFNSNKGPNRLAHCMLPKRGKVNTMSPFTDPAGSTLTIPKRQNGTCGAKCCSVCFSFQIPTLNHCFSPWATGFPQMMTYGCGGNTPDPDHCLKEGTDNGLDGPEFNPIDGRTNTLHQQNGEIRNSQRC